ncbi:DUF5302 domain-containing protein [Paenarthrobacter sp. Z7-10]|uniref:DUF5302 domain-containing protein n=1 Tax=Paenarthrobacter sp. Z7-10 TaxID=2787635 RepID=UPI0022A91DC0|nr:DUF5302 domain-containing protein [Paenarthrobacter sp. Z7-10]MCZ2403735.1 DUF5302 domain-containing protein [Paenarthrobacter sp. Z7-10]
MSASDEHGEATKDAPAKAGTNEEQKRKFREALDRKNSQHHATVETANGTKISQVHGSASQKREFRRKSG